MSDVSLILVGLAAVLGGVFVASMGALDALQVGEKWSWSKYGKSLLMCVVSGASYAWIMSKADISHLSLALIIGFLYGAGVDVASNRGISLFNKTSSSSNTPTVTPK